MYTLIFSTIIVLGGEWYFFGTVAISNNDAISFVFNLLIILSVASIFAPITQRTNDLMDADIRRDGL